MMFISRLILILCLSAATVSCSVMRSAPNKGDKPASYHSGGAYSLPMTMMKLTIKSNEAGDITVEEPTLTRVPDGKMLFNLDYLADITSDDTFKVELDESGFLKQVTVTADDKKGPIIETLASTVLTLMTGIPVNVGALTDGEKRAINKSGILFQQTINPNDDVELRQLNKKLSKYKLGVDVAPFGTGQNTEKLPPSEASSDRTGIFYRPLRPYIVSIRDISTPDWDTFAAYIIQTENASPLISVDISRSYFVKRGTTLMFNHGILTSAEVKKPSEILGLVRIPLDIANAIVDIPARLLQFRIDYLSKQTSLAENEKKLIEAEQKVADLEKKAKENEKAAASSTGGSNNPTTSSPTEGTSNQRDGD